MKYSTKRDKFALKTWRLFDELVQAEYPNIDPQYRYELANSWDKTLVALFSRLDNIKNLKKP